ncbi:ABC transporter substrate-binding protein [Sanguibacter suaedae]|uniref:Extracellular solute-binding protein n=1 Tax=Sanguibacter suaedae TaxID=2795737 RepID=A0A934I639_9MICO|nr:extracellular solute-binding protein [Sanguibacter suaedae]MBI9113882.1 extracellular solute-binding protein [Sanguibacter suaedae]
MKTRKFLAATTAAMIGAAGLAACGGGDEGSDGDVAMTFWHNSTTGPGKEYWESTVADFEAANPGVTIDIQSIQNEQMDGKLQTALNSGDAPDIFMARGGGKLADVVAAGQVKDLTGEIADDVRADVPETAFSAFTIDDKVYGMPMAILPGGMYYTESLFDQAGVAEIPTTVDELVDVTDTLDAAGIQPIALGGKDAWPAAHWYYFFALRECPQDVFESADDLDFSHECWTKAGEDLEAFAETEPFNDGFLTTSAQGSAGSSAGLLANYQAGMELMGAWNIGVTADLTPDKEPLPDLRWFPFPEVEGGEGDPAALMGGVDGFSCSEQAPDECVDFLNFAMSQENQEGYATAFHTVPANTAAQGVVEDPALVSVLEAYNEAPYVALWLDSALGQNVGNALNAAIVEMLAGDGDAASIVTALDDAAAKG